MKNMFKIMLAGVLVTSTERKNSTLNREHKIKYATSALAAHKS